MADKLTGEQVVQLIKSYKNKECLWNRQDKLYRDFSERNKCYVELCKEFNLPESEIKKKIVNLRTWFARVLRRIETSKRQHDETGIIYEPSSPIFDAMLFLSDVLRRQTKERRRFIKKSESNNEDDESLQEVEEYIIQEKDSDVADDSNAYDPMEEETYYMSRVKNKSVEERKTKRLKFESSTPENCVNNFIEDAGASSVDLNAGYNYNNIENDEIDYFCKSLASQMRKLTARSMIELQMEIQNAVSKKRLQDWDKSYKH